MMAIEASGLAAESHEFRLHVVGPDDKSIPKARVQFWWQPSTIIHFNGRIHTGDEDDGNKSIEGNQTAALSPPTAEQFGPGKVLEMLPAGAVAETDDNGLLALKLPRLPGRSLAFEIAAPGYGSYFDGGPISRWPARVTAQLEHGWSIGGIMTDVSGNPVEGARISLGGSPALAGGNGFVFVYPPRDITSDSSGRWSFDGVPASSGSVSATIKHPEFTELSRRMSRSEFETPSGGQPRVKIVLDHGIILTGQVTDDLGAPLEDAIVTASAGGSTITGADGRYRLAGFKPLEQWISVWKKGRATQAKDAKMTAGMKPVDFPMKQGGHVRVRVIDQAGDAVPNSYISLPWPLQLYLHSSGLQSGEQKPRWIPLATRADENGIWEWDEAPLEPFAIDISPPEGNGMTLKNQRVTARDEEYVFRIGPAVVISGKVLHAETKQPIDSLSITPSWNTMPDRFSGTGGKYQIRCTQPFAHQALHVEAEGYLPAVSRTISSDEGDMTIDFELKREPLIVKGKPIPDIVDPYR